MVCHLCCGITIVLYDGNPLIPSRTIMFDLVDAHKCVERTALSSLVMLCGQCDLLFSFASISSNPPTRRTEAQGDALSGIARRHLYHGISDES